MLHWLDSTYVFQKYCKTMCKLILLEIDLSEEFYTSTFDSRGKIRKQYYGFHFIEKYTTNI